MSRPRREPADRVTTGVRFGPELHERLRLAADERDVSMNRLVVRAVTDFLDRLIPVDEIQWTRPSPGVALKEERT